MKCLLLGGGGFLGLNLAGLLRSRGHEVRIFDRPAAILRARRLGFGGELEWIEGDFANERDVDSGLRGAEAVFHLVSTTLPKSSNENPAYDIETNVIATIRMLEAARRHRVGKVLFSSSGGTIYGRPLEIPIRESHPTEPTCSYGIGKLAIEKYLHLYHQMHGLEFRILRVANPYGEGQNPEGSQGAVSVFLSRALNGAPIEIWGDGSVVRDFLHVADVSDAFVRAMDYDGAERVFNIGAGRGHSLKELVDAIEKLMGVPAKVAYLPTRGFDVPVNVLDISRARSELGFEPQVSLADGLARTRRWLDQTHLERTR